MEELSTTKLFIEWNKALFSYFFLGDMESEEEVSLYVDSDKISEIGKNNGLGGCDEFMRMVLLPVDARQQVYFDIRKLYAPQSWTKEQRTKFKSANLFDFATIYIDQDLDENIDYPLYFIYLVFAVLMGSECHKSGEPGIGNYMFAFLRNAFPGHTSRRNSLEELFNALAQGHPRFHAKRLTDQQYIGLIKYQLGLSRAQEEELKQAMFSADLSEDLPYDMWALKLRDYTDRSMKDMLKKSISDSILRHRISSLRYSFDPALYEQKYRDANIYSKGEFVLAVYEDEYAAENDRLVLLTDINNKSIEANGLKIEKGGIDRLGEYAQYNINHVLINHSDKAEMKSYSLLSGNNKIASNALGNIVTFSRCSSNYLIQTKYPQKGKETYILVKNGHDEEWQEWLREHGTPEVILGTNDNRVQQIFGLGWSMYNSSEVECAYPSSKSDSTSSIVMDGGIECIGKNKVYLITALPCFEFPASIDIDKLTIYVNVDSIPLEASEISTRIVDNTRLVIDLPSIEIRDLSHEVSITLEYATDINRKKKLSFHEDFFVTGQDVRYNENELFAIDMWGRVKNTDSPEPYLRGMSLHNGGDHISLPNLTCFYQNSGTEIDINDPRFYLVNLLTATCSMRPDFSITENHLRKSIRYAATRFDINITSIPNFYRDVKYLLINGGYINVDNIDNIDDKNNKYQPIPPTFIETPLSVNFSQKLYMLVGAYTKKFLNDLIVYCKTNKVSMYIYSNSNGSENNVVNSLLPPILLLQSNFAPERFKNEVNSNCMFISNDDVAIDILRSLPTYEKYENTLQYVNPDVFDTPLLDPEDTIFPRIRKSIATGYKASYWIERKENEFSRISIGDLAWAKLYCFYKWGRSYCTQNQTHLIFPVNLHLPVMMQRALFIANCGGSQIAKAFICYNDSADKNYYNLIKRYKINDATTPTRMPHIIKAITNRTLDKNNLSLRESVGVRYYRLFMWYNKNRYSESPRSLLVMKDKTYGSVHAYAFRCGDDMKIFFTSTGGKDLFKRVDGSDVNNIFSKYMTSSKTWEQLGISFKEEYSALPPSEDYIEEEILII